MLLCQVKYETVPCSFLSSWPSWDNLSWVLRPIFILVRAEERANSFVLVKFLWINASDRTL